MGYFSNGTEGRDYQATFCNRCELDVDEKCPVWLAHLMHNGEDNPVLDLLIPRDENGRNLQCDCFVEIDR